MVDGIKVNYKLEGEEGAELVVALHGFGYPSFPTFVFLFYSSTTFLYYYFNHKNNKQNQMKREVEKMVVEKGYQILLFDFYGHGASESPVFILLYYSFFPINIIINIEGTI